MAADHNSGLRAGPGANFCPERGQEPRGFHPYTEGAKLDTEKAKLLWDEYKYRHDLIWKNIYKFTAASVALSVVPYARELGGIFESLWWLLLFPPLLAVVLALAAFPVMKTELQLFRQIKERYRSFQEHKLRFGIDYGPDYKPIFPRLQNVLRFLPFRRNGQSEQKISRFERSVHLYLVVLLVLMAGNLVFAAASYLFFK